MEEPLDATANIEVAQELTEKIVSWAEAGIAMLPNFILAFLIVVATGLTVKLLSRGVARIIEDTHFSEHPQLVTLSIGMAKIAGWAGGLFVALTVLNLDKTVTSMLAGLGILGLALGFAFKDLATNFMAGIMMTIRKPFKIGDVIEATSANIVGTVESIDLREVLVRKFDGELAMIPNKEVYENTIVSRSVPMRRVSVEVGISYGDHLEEAKQALVGALEAIHPRADKPVEVYFKEFGGSSINLDCRMWIERSTQPDILEVRSKMVMAINHALDEAGCTIPFPIQTLDFGGVVGGQSFSKILEHSNALSGADHSTNGRRDVV